MFWVENQGGTQKHKKIGYKMMIEDIEKKLKKISIANRLLSTLEGFWFNPVERTSF